MIAAGCENFEGRDSVSEASRLKGSINSTFGEGERSAMTDHRT